MKSNFHSNQILYVKGIGYARLAIDRQTDPKGSDVNKTVQNPISNQIAQQQNDQCNDGVLFDPDMFKIDSDSPFAQVQVQVNLSELNTRKKSMQVIRRQSTDIKNRQLIIVPLKLEQCNAMIYCPETYLMKKITINVRSLLQNCRKQVNISIEITKTIDNFKNLLFKELGEEFGLYSEIRMFTIASKIEELSIGSKTIWQYQLKDKCRVTVAGKFNFTFKSLPQGREEYFVLSNNNNTIANVQKKVQTPIVLNAQNTPTIQPVTTLPAEQPKKIVQIVPPAIQSPPLNIVSQQKPTQLQQSQKLPQKQQKPSQQQKLHLQCNAKFRSGIHYWQVKIDRLNPNKESNSLLIGIGMKNQILTQSQDFLHLWAFDPIRCKKIQLSDQKKLHLNEKEDKELNGSDESDEEYGSFAKNGDSVGVLLIIKEKIASLVFYKNSICLSECYQFSVESLKEENSKNKVYLYPFVSLSGQIQLSLDSKATAPLDSFRFK